MVSGLSIRVGEEAGAYTLTKVLLDGKEIKDTDTFRVTCLNTAAYMAPFLKDESREFERARQGVRQEWTAYITAGGSLAQPESYIKLR